MSVKPQPTTGSDVPAGKGLQLAPARKPAGSGSSAKVIAWLLASVFIGLLGYKWLQGRPDANQNTANLRVSRVQLASAAPELRVSGSTAARNFISVTAPMMRGPDSGRALILLNVAPSGSLVKKGQKIAEIDAQSILDHVDDVNASFVQADGDVRKRKAEQAIETENLNQNLRIAKSNLDSAKLDASASAIRSDIDKEELKLTVEEAEAQYKAVQAAFQLTRAKHASEIKILEYTRERHARHRDRHKHDADSFTLFAPISGMVVMQSIFRGGDMGQVQAGDQLSPGQPFLKIVDPNSIQLEARMNQVESEGLRLGQPADVRIDAFPGLLIRGRLASIGAIGVTSGRDQQYLRTIPVRVALLDQDPRVIPDLSGSADIQLAAPSTGMSVPLEGLQNENGTYFVLVRSGDQYVRRNVELAAQTHTQAVVKSGLNAGDEVVLNR